MEWCEREAFSFTFQMMKIVNHEEKNEDAKCMKYENTETRIVSTQLYVAVGSMNTKHIF